MPETMEATERATALAEKSDNLAQLVNSVIRAGITAPLSGDLPIAGALADQALRFALHEGSPTRLGNAHEFQIITHYLRGDLAGAEKHFTAGLKFFDDPGLMQIPGAPYKHLVSQAITHGYLAEPLLRANARSR